MRGIEGLQLQANKPRNAKDWQPQPEARRRRGKILPYGFQRAWTWGHLGFGLLASRNLWDKKFLLFETTQFVVLCYSSPKKLIRSLTTPELCGGLFFPIHENKQGTSLCEFLPLQPSELGCLLSLWLCNGKHGNDIMADTFGFSSIAILPHFC